MSNTTDPAVSQNVSIDLSAVIVTVEQNEPQVMVLPDKALPSGPFGTEQRTLEQGLRAWVAAQSGLRLGYVEQLYTFADQDRTAHGHRMVSIGYLALVHAPLSELGPQKTACWYSHFPWEDLRGGISPKVMEPIRNGLDRWSAEVRGATERRAREMRIAINFPRDPRAWNDELVLQRYELLWEAGLIEEARRAQTRTAERETGSFLKGDIVVPGVPMPHDHRRILATAIARLRAKIKYRPVVFELMPEKFTLLELQNTVEALAGLRLHKQNFRRLVQGQGLVEEASGTSCDTRGRPARLYTFRRQVLRERAVAGTKLARSS